MTPRFMVSILRAEAVTERRLVNRAVSTYGTVPLAQLTATMSEKGKQAQMRAGIANLNEKWQQRAILRGLGYTPAF